MNDYGFQFRQANGDIGFDTRHSTLRLVNQIERAGSYTGTETFPDFDRSKGMFTVYVYAVKHNNYHAVIGVPVPVPNLEWDNSKGEMTFSPGDTISFPWGRSWVDIYQQDYVVKFWRIE